MRWYEYSFWRIAYSRNRSGILTDARGKWIHFFKGIWILRERV